MRVLFKIFPSSGYKNSQFQAVTTLPEIVIQIEGPGGNILTISALDGQPATLTKLTEPGNYRAHATINGQFHEQHFRVLDGIRIGSSELKQACVFDNMPYAFFLMRDRMYIHHESTNSVWEESLSPSSIVQLTTNSLLFKTELGADPATGFTITNLGIYSLDSFSVEAELLDHYILIWLDSPRKRLWLYCLAEQRIICLSTQATNGAYWQELLSVPTEPDWKLQAGNALLFSKTTTSITIINTEKLLVTSIPQELNLAIDETGNCYQVAGRNLYLTNSPFVRPEKSLFEVPATASLQTQGFYFVGAAFQLATSPTEFDCRFREVVATFEPSTSSENRMLPSPIVCGSEPIVCTIYPAPNGLYVVQSGQQRTISGVRYTRPQVDRPQQFTPISTDSFDYKLDYYGAAAKPTILVKTSPAPINIALHFKGTLVITHNAHNLLIQGSQYLVAIAPQAEEFQIISTENNRHYLLASYSGTIDLFSLVSPLPKLLANVTLVDSERPTSSSILWYYSEPDKPAGYNLTTNNKIVFYTQGSRQSLLTKAYAIALSATHATIKNVLVENTALVMTNVLITSTGIVRASVPGNLVAISPNLTKVICRRGEELYVLTYQQAAQNYTSQIVALPLPNYQESYLSPDGKFLMLKDKTQQYLLYNIATGETSIYLSGKFLAFDKSGSLIFEDNSTRSARLLDPVTFEDVTPLSYHHYRFLSPDGKLFAQTVAETKYYAGVFGGYITTANIQWLRNILDHGGTVEDQKEEKIRLVQQTRRDFYAKHSTYFASQGITEADKLRSWQVYETHKRLQIGIVGTATVTEVSLPVSMNYFNYAAFSFDNKWIAAVGKAPGCGFVTVAKLVFDSVNQLLVATPCFESDYPETATWVCGVSKTNQFATYTSNGNTYTLELGDDLLGAQPTREKIQANFVRRRNTVAASSGVWNRIAGKNYLCYSPSGRFMALSEQRYDPISLGGTGHQASNAVHVVNAQDYTPIDSFYGHGAMIKDDKTKKLVFAAFSEDEQHLMSMSTDGVVIVRRIAATT